MKKRVLSLIAAVLLCVQMMPAMVMAADQGHPTAMFAVGDCYYKGTGVEKDLEEAAKWYQKALEAGYEPDEEDQEHLAAVLGEGYDA